MHGEYRYSLPEPLEVDRRDAVLHFMKRTIRKLQMENINVGVQRYKIQGLTCHRPIWPLDLANAPFPTKLYAIKPCWEEFPACIIVTVEDRGTILTLTTDRVKVKLYPTAEGARWMPIDKFLTAWATPRYGGSIHPGLSDEAAQRKWWPMTGKSFRFLDLPKEIRLQILAHALGTEVQPRFVYNTRSGTYDLDLCAPRSSSFLWNSMPDIVQPNKAVFDVSRQVDDEAWEAIVVGREKHFYSEACLSDVLQRQIPPALAGTNWLSKVTLKLTLTKFFEFFGWEFNPVLQPRSNTPYTVSPAEMLQRSPLIEELTLDIQNPYTDGRHPWRSMQDYTPRSDDRIDWVSVETYFTTYTSHSPCYRTIVNWLLILAFPYIKGIPKVNLRGAVKTTIKKDWARILSIEYKKSIGEEVFDTHSFDYQASLDSLLVIPASEL